MKTGVSKRNAQHIDKRDDSSGESDREVEKQCKVCNRSISPEFYQKQKRLICRECHNLKMQRRRSGNNVTIVNNQIASNITNVTVINQTINYNTTINTTINNFITKPLREYDEELKKWNNLDVEKMQKNEFTLIRNLRKAKHPEDIHQLEKQLKNLRAKFNPPDYGKACDEYEANIRRYKENPTIPTQNDIKELVKFMQETLEPKEAVKDEKGNDIDKDEVFMTRARNVLRQFQFYKFEGVANTEELLKLESKIRRKHDELEEQDRKFIAYESQRAKKEKEKQEELAKKNLSNFRDQAVKVLVDLTIRGVIEIHNGEGRYTQDEEIRTEEDEQVVDDDELEHDKRKAERKLREEEEDKRIESLRNEASELNTKIKSLTEAYRTTKSKSIKAEVKELIENYHEMKDKIRIHNKQKKIDRRRKKKFVQSRRAMWGSDYEVDSDDYD